KHSRCLRGRGAVGTPAEQFEALIACFARTALQREATNLQLFDRRERVGSIDTDMSGLSAALLRPFKRQPLLTELRGDTCLSGPEPHVGDEERALAQIIGRQNLG